MDKYQKTILNELLNKYEKSLSYLGKNKVSQSFSINISKKFPRYTDDAEYELFKEINNSLAELETAGIVKLEHEKNGTIKKAVLVNENLKGCYNLLERIPRKQQQELLLSVIEDNMQGKTDSRYEPASAYLKEQKNRIAANKNVEFYDGDMDEYQKLLNMLAAVIENEEEIYIRDFSIKEFGDSKTAESLRSKAQAILFQYGEYEEKEHVLEEYGIVNTPTYVYIKGHAEIVLGEQHIDMSKIRGDLAFSSETLKSLGSVAVGANKIVTIENLTSFHDFDGRGALVIYLGGFHNRTRRNFLKKVYDDNPGCRYFHFGDIDAGGFHILSHLREKTGIRFMPLHMGRETLEEYKEFTKRLTQNDRQRLEKLLEKYDKETDREYANICIESVKYMLANDCKLEQEAVREPAQG